MTKDEKKMLLDLLAMYTYKVVDPAHNAVKKSRKAGRAQELAHLKVVEDAIATLYMEIYAQYKNS